MKIFKFGGASVKNAAAVRNVAEIVSLYDGQKITIVVSAMGKTTNKLEEIVHALATKDRKIFMALVDDLLVFHETILGELFPERHYAVYAEMEAIFEALRLRFDQPFSDNYSFEYDQIVSIGEVLSSVILAAFLREKGFPAVWADARKLIRTDHLYQ